MRTFTKMPSTFGDLKLGQPFRCVHSSPKNDHVYIRASTPPGGPTTAYNAVAATGKLWIFSNDCEVIPLDACIVEKGAPYITEEGATDYFRPKMEDQK